MGEKAAYYGCLFLFVMIPVAAIYNILFGPHREGGGTLLIFLGLLILFYICDALDPKNANRRKRQARSRVPKRKAPFDKRKAMREKSGRGRPLSEILQRSDEPRGESGRTGAPYRVRPVMRYTLDEHGNVVDVNLPD